MPAVFRIARISLAKFKCALLVYLVTIVRSIQLQFACASVVHGLQLGSVFHSQVVRRELGGVRSWESFYLHERARAVFGLEGPLKIELGRAYRHWLPEP